MRYSSRQSAACGSNNQRLSVIQKHPNHVPPGGSAELFMGGPEIIERASISALDVLRVSQIYPGTQAQQAKARQWAAAGS
jgi:hypothetical protein